MVTAPKNGGQVGRLAMATRECLEIPAKVLHTATWAAPLSRMASPIGRIAFSRMLMAASSIAIPFIPISKKVPHHLQLRQQQPRLLQHHLSSEPVDVSTTTMPVVTPLSDMCGVVQVVLAVARRKVKTTATTRRRTNRPVMISLQLALPRHTARETPIAQITLLSVAHSASITRSAQTPPFHKFR